MHEEVLGKRQHNSTQNVVSQWIIKIMTTHNLLMLPGDGIGPEVAKEVERVAQWFGKVGIATFNTEKDLVGGAAYDAHKVAISDAAMARAQAADAVLFGAVFFNEWLDGIALIGLVLIAIAGLATFMREDARGFGP